MLNWLRITNLALVEELDIEFSAGFNVITGETGAGKSVIMGAIGLLLGERAEKNAIRKGTKRCEVSAGLQLNDFIHKRIGLILEEAGIETTLDDDLQIRRVITPSSTRNFINDTPVTLQTLKTIGDCLIDIHGANEHQSLIKPSTQLDLLDRYGNLETTLQLCRDNCEQIKAVIAKQEALQANLPSAVEAEHLRMVQEEIDRVAPQPNEDDEISARHKVAANAQVILQTANQAIYALSEADQSILTQLSDSYRTISELQRLDEAGCTPFLEQCDQITDMIRELCNDIEHYATSIDLNEEEFMELENRLGELQRLKRRYGPTLEHVFESAKSASSRLAVYDNAEQARTDLARELDELRNTLNHNANELSMKRKHIARKFAKEVKQELQTLGFLDADFEIAFADTEAGPRGKDKIDFMFTANPGEPPQPLRQVASSGEMSRVMLALKTVLAEADAVPILIFDEIDVNIGGETALKVGSELLKLSQSHQLLCISHLPQVAARANTHFLVEKQVSDNRTFTSINALDDNRRLSEISRMLGGGDAAKQHANELINTLQN